MGRWLPLLLLGSLLTRRRSRGSRHRRGAAWLSMLVVLSLALPGCEGTVIRAPDRIAPVALAMLHGEDGALVAKREVALQHRAHVFDEALREGDLALHE